MLHVTCHISRVGVFLVLRETRRDLTHLLLKFEPMASLPRYETDISFQDEKGVRRHDSIH